MPTIDTQDISKYPTQPGVYLMKDKAGIVIYVGKAKSLRARLRNYFSGSDDRLNVLFLLRRVDSIETIVTQNEKEALLLENTLIKKHKPRYNIRLRDDKNFLSIRIDTKHEWPMIQLTRKRRGDGAHYFGPFSNAAAVRSTIRNLLKLFPLRSCKDSDFYNRARTCILYDVGKCCGPCVLDVDKNDYMNLVRQVILFLNGQRDELTAQLKKLIEQHSENLEFEKAMKLRDKLTMIRKTREHQMVATQKDTDIDVIALATGEGFHSIVVHHYRESFLQESRRFKIRDVGQEAEYLLSEFLLQFYERRLVPRQLLLSDLPEDNDVIAELLRELREGAVTLHKPERGRQRELVQLAQANAEENLRKTIEKERNVEETLAVLQTALKLPRLPRTIECFDISNIQGVFAVGSLVQFKDGEANKSGYRRFKIKTVEGSDDFAMMQEVIERRYGRLLEAQAKMPDLVIVDGGKGQLNSAIEIFRQLGIQNLPIAGLAKSRLKDLPGPVQRRVREPKRRTEERLFLPNRKNPVVLKHGSQALYLVQRIRDEAHRFAITYHIKLRSAANLHSILDEIPGVGPTRRRALLKYFGSLSKIKKADIEELQNAPGITEKLAGTIAEFLAISNSEELGVEKQKK